LPAWPNGGGNGRGGNRSGNNARIESNGVAREMQIGSRPAAPGRIIDRARFVIGRHIA
jgi:hypothetical protein